MADYLKECYSEAKDATDVDASVEDFKATFCSTCMNTSCKQSKWRDSAWEQRMDRQEQTLKNPSFADPDDPKYKGLSTQHFVSVEEAKQNKQYGGWIEVDEDGKVVQETEENKPKNKVHKANPPTEEKPSRNVDRSQQVLEALRKGEDPPPEPEDEDKKQTEKEPEPEKPPAQKEQPDQSGKMLGQQSSQSVLANQTQKDDWTITDDSDKNDDGPLTVRINDGKKAD